MVGNNSFNRLILKFAFVAILLIIFVPQINRIYLNSHAPNHNHNHNQYLILGHQHNFQQNLTPFEIVKSVIKKSSESKKLKFNHLINHKHLCEYCVLAAQILVTLCLAIILFSLKISCKKIRLTNFWVTYLCLDKSHPTRAGPCAHYF